MITIGPRTIKDNCNTKTKIDHGWIRNRYAKLELVVGRLIRYTKQMSATVSGQIVTSFYICHYQPGSNIIIVYSKHITHARACAHRRAFQVSDWSVAPNRDGAFRWRQRAPLLHSNKHKRGRSSFPRFCVFRV